MPKLKTKSAVKKRFKARGDGTLMAKKSGKKHNLRKRQTKLNRQKEGFFEVHKSHVKLVAKCTPYGLK